MIRVFSTRRRCSSLQFPLVSLLLFPLLLLPLTASAVPATSFAVGTSPVAVAVNPVSNKVYMVNSGSSSVTVLSGTYTTTSITVGNNPQGIVINPVTNKVYVTNHADGTVNVINGDTDAVIATVTVRNLPKAIAVNPVTNKIYVATTDAGSMTVIDGTNNSAADITVGINCGAIAVNPVTNRIYVTNSSAATVKVIDGSNDTVLSTITVEGIPLALVTNPVTNKIYVVNPGGPVSVIDGVHDNDGTYTAGSRPPTVTVGGTPVAIAVNPVNNRVYVANQSGNSVTVINGMAPTDISLAGTSPNALSVNPTTGIVYAAGINAAIGRVHSIDTGGNAQVLASSSDTPANNLNNPWAVAVNPVTNKIFVVNNGSASVTVINGALNTAAGVNVGAYPQDVAVNPGTNKIYVVNNGSDSVSVVDGANNAVVTVSTGSSPYAVAVNPVTNKVYVANDVSNNVTVFDGATNTAVAASPVTVGTSPEAITVNPVTNKIYVANYLGNSVSVINGTTDSVTTTITAGTKPRAIAVNPVTNRIYVANYVAAASIGSVTVIDGTTDTAIATVTVGKAPVAIAVNPVTNKIYVANSGAGTAVTVIDGSTNATSTVTVGATPWAVAVNPVTNKIYVANKAGNSVRVINGPDNTTTLVAVGTNPYAVAVNPATNKIFVANYGSSNVTVIDGSTNLATTVSAGTSPYAVAANPASGKIYVVNYGSSNITAIDEQPEQAIPLGVTVSPLVGNVTTSSTPTFSFTASSSFTPTAPALQKVYYQFDTCQGPWKPTTTGSTVNDATSLLNGNHILYLFATDGQEASSTTSVGSQNSPLIGSIAAYAFTVAVPPAYTLTVAKSGAGTGGVTSTPIGISCGPTCSADFSSNVSLTATPDSGSVFSGWTGACSGTGTCTVTMDAAKNVTATFDLAPVNGACGGANGQIFTVAPSVSLCSTGTPGAVTGTGPWNWSCNGANSGTNAACSASLPSSQNITFTLQPTAIYGDAPITLVATASSGLPVSLTLVSGPGTISGNTLTINGTGNIVVTASQIGNGAYSVAADVSRTLTVNKANLTVTATAQSKTYGATDPNLTYSVTGLINGDSLTGTLSRIVGENVGSYQINQGSLNASANYILNFTGAAFNITGASASISVGNLGHTYDGADKQATAVTTPPALPVTITYNGSAALPANAGTYSVVATINDPNYSGTTGGTLTIAKAAPLITWNNPASIIYGTPLSATQLNAAGSAAGTIVYSPAAGTVLTSGTNALSATFTPSDSANYLSATATVSLTVNKANLNVTADTKNRVYNVSNPALTAGYSGFVNGDTQSVLSGSPVIATTALINSPVGNYPITVSQGTLSAANYSFTFTSGLLSVGLASQAITFSPLATVTYGDSDITPGATSSSGLPVTYTSSNSSVAAIVSGKLHLTGSGTATITARQSGNASFDAATDVSQVLTVNKANLTVTATAQSKVYGAADPLLTYNVTGLIGSETLTGALARAAGESVGSYQITQGALTASANYTLTFSGATFNITGSTATIALGSLNQSYNGTARTATAVTAPAGLPVIITYNGSPTAPVNSGSYAVVATINDSNYNGSASGTLVIGKATPVITWANPAAIPYGTALSAIQLNAAATTAGMFTYSPAAGAVLNSGTQTVSATFTPSDSANYLSATATVSLTVNKANINVTADTKSRAYNVPNPALTAGYSGFVNGETAAVLSGSPVVTTTAVIGSPVGNYPITVSQGMLSAANYSFTFTSGLLSVGLASQVITFNPLAAAAYGNSDITPGATSSSGLPVTFTSSNPSVATIAAGKIHVTGAGTTTITARQSGDASFGAAVDVTQTLTVTTAPLTVTATAQSKVYGAADPLLTYSVAGLIGSDTLTGALARAAGESVESYPINQGTLTASANYTLTFSGATFNITGSTATVTLGGLNQSYNGTARTATAVTAPAGLPVTITYNGSATAPLNAGTYAVVATINDWNYNGSASGTLVIGKTTPVITWANPAAIPYGTALSATQLNAAGSTAGMFVYSPTEGAVLNSGTQTVSATFTPSDSANYLSATATVSLTVNKANLTVSAIAQSKPYGATDPTLTYSVTGLINGDTLTGALARTAGENVGSYQINQGSLAAASNYLLNFTGATFSITGVPASIAIGNLSHSYDGAAKQATAVTTPAGLPLTITYNGSATAPVNAGSYAVVATISDANYSGTASGTLTIAKATPAITWSNPTSIPYGTPLSTTQLNAAASTAGAFVYLPTAGTLEPSGSQTLAVTFLPTDSTNYNNATATVPLTVNKAQLFVTANLLGKVFGAADPQLTYSVSGLIGSDTLTGALARTAGENIGSYPISQGTLAALSNYLLNFTGASFNITASTAAITLGNLSHTYDGTARAATVVTTPTGLPVTITYNGSATAPVNAGSYAVVATISDANYSGTASGTLIIDKAIPVLTWANPVAITFGTALSATQLDAVADVPGTFAYTPAAGIIPNLGTQTLSVTFTPTDSANCNSHTAQATLTVNSPPPVIVTTPVAQVATGSDGALLTTLEMTSATSKIVIFSGAKMTDASGNIISGTLSVTANPLTSLPSNAASAATFDGKKLVGLGGAIDITISNGTATVKTITPPMSVNLAVAPTFAAPGSVVQYFSYDGGSVWTLEGTATVKADSTVDMLVGHLSIKGVAKFEAPAQLPSGDINGDGKVDLADALKALQFSVGIFTPSAAELAAGDVAPLVDGKPVPNGMFNVEDAVMLLQKAVGLISW